MTLLHLAQAVPQVAQPKDLMTFQWVVIGALVLVVLGGSQKFLAMLKVLREEGAKREADLREDAVRREAECRKEMAQMEARHIAREESLRADIEKGQGRLFALQEKNLWAMQSISEALLSLEKVMGPYFEDKE